MTFPKYDSAGTPRTSRSTSGAVTLRRSCRGTRVVVWACQGPAGARVSWCGRVKVLQERACSGEGVRRSPMLDALLSFCGVCMLIIARVHLHG
eukprot:66021-Chlamydomonas_euryale.AAC.2